jgi:guanine deaminase
MALHSQTANYRAFKHLTAYLGHIISPLDEHQYVAIAHGALVVDESGTICGVGPWDRLRDEFPSISRIVDYGKRLIMPGFVDLHLHLPQIAQIGRAGDSLLGWLQKFIFPAEAAFADEVHASRMANWFFDELGRSGTTLAAVFNTVHPGATDIAFRVAASRGARVIMGKTMMDFNSPAALSEDTARSLEQSEQLCKRWHGFDNDRLQYAFTPRFAVTSTPQLLQGAAALWRNYPGTFMHTHLAENAEEVLQVRQQFAGARSYLEVYHQHGLVGDNSLFAHAIHLDDADFDLVLAQQATLVHCPSSNFFLKSGVFPYAKARELKTKFALGSDVAAGPEMCMYRVMKDAAFMQSELWIQPEELFYRATLGGAKAVGMADRVGSLAAGKEADFIVVNPLKRSNVSPDVLERSTEDILSTLVYLGDDRMVEATFVRGKTIFEAASLPEERLASTGQDMKIEYATAG